VRWSVLLLVVVGCGRIGFDPPGSGSSAGDATRDTSAEAGEEPTTCDADGQCPLMCVGMGDPDCVASCGDSTCSGGETCRSCGADCKTTMNVCGNGSCGAGETTANCFTDCGPTPWTWQTDEADLLARINNARTTGTTCPGGVLATAPALALATDLQGGARDWAWERAHLGTSGFFRCNGSSAPGDTYQLTSGPMTNTDRMNNLLADMASCNNMMSTANAEAGVGIAVDTRAVLVVLYR
jgi:hypothetical protein